MSRSRPAGPDVGRTSVGRALISGAFLGIAFLTPALGWVAWFAFVPLLDALDGRLRARAPLSSLFAAGWRFGLAWFGIAMHWILRLDPVAMTVPWLKWPAWLAAASYLALYPGLAAAGAGWLARRSGLSLAVTFPVAFLVIEELRGSGELGFPWFQPGYTQAGMPPLIQAASLGSVSLVTLWLLALNALLWRSLTARSRLRTALGAALAFLLPLFWGMRALDAAPHGAGPHVALVQPNIPSEMKWSGRHQGEILQRFVRLTEGAASSAPRPITVIWPETATGSYLRRQVEQAVVVEALAVRTGVPVFSGYADFETGPDGATHSYNAAGVFGLSGDGARYAKRHLVPFGERMPFQRVLPFLGKIALGQAEWTPGTEAVLFPSEAGPFSCLICFESIFPDLARRDVRHGARWLVNVTNDEWFGDSPALSQHAAMAQFRAVENHVPLARCANTGITELIDANGRVKGRLPVFKEGVLAGALAAPGPPTPFSRWGDWPGIAALLSALALAFAPMRFALRGTR